MKVTFLDIDGVVATDVALEKLLCSYYGISPDAEDRFTMINKALKGKTLPRPRYEREYFPFSTEAIENLYSLQRQTGCSYVMSSSWRDDRNVEDINDIMALKGLYLTFIDKTKDPSFTVRGEEIQHWLRKHPEVERYVVIDDGFIGAYDERESLRAWHPGKVILTDPVVGFTKASLEEAMRILNSP